MIAVDTNIQVYAHRADSPFHDRARSAINQLSLDAKVHGGAIHGARIAAICLSHGVAEL